jgi:hypothetical protein
VGILGVADAADAAYALHCLSDDADVRLVKRFGRKAKLPAAPQTDYHCALIFVTPADRRQLPLSCHAGLYERTMTVRTRASLVDAKRGATAAETVWPMRQPTGIVVAAAIVLFPFLVRWLLLSSMGTRAVFLTFILLLH